MGKQRMISGDKGCIKEDNSFFIRLFLFDGLSYMKLMKIVSRCLVDETFHLGYNNLAKQVLPVAENLICVHETHSHVEICERNC